MGSKQPPLPNQSPVVGRHDLEGVRLIIIRGWSGPVRIEEKDQSGVGVASTRRHPTEHGWIFAPVTPKGVLVCFSDLLGSPGLLRLDQRPGAALLIELPLGKKAGIRVECCAE